jgi:hypothetical protein
MPRQSTTPQRTISTRRVTTPEPPVTPFFRALKEFSKPCSNLVTCALVRELELPNAEFGECFTQKNRTQKKI